MLRDSVKRKTFTQMIPYS